MSLNLDSKIKLRLSWIRRYEELNHAGKVCDHFGISRFTLRKWLKRYELSGIEGLYDLSSRPHNFPNKKVSKEQPLSFEFSKKNLEEANKIIKNYPDGKQQSAVMSLLYLAQKQNENWIPLEAMKYIAKFLSMPYIKAY